MVDLDAMSARLTDLGHRLGLVCDGEQRSLLVHWTDAQTLLAYAHELQALKASLAGAQASLNVALGLHQD